MTNHTKESQDYSELVARLRTVNAFHDPAKANEATGEAADAIEALSRPGWQLVPIEPTVDMDVDGIEASLLGRPSIDDPTYVHSIYRAMLCAAPSKPDFSHVASGKPEGSAARVSVPVEPTMDMVIAGFEAVSEFMDSEECAEMSGCQASAEAARICYRTMLAAVSPSGDVPTDQRALVGDAIMHLEAVKLYHFADAIRSLLATSQGEASPEENGHLAGSTKSADTRLTYDELEGMYFAQCQCTDEWAAKAEAAIEAKADATLLARIAELEGQLAKVNARLSAALSGSPLANRSGQMEKTEVANEQSRGKV